MTERERNHLEPWERSQALSTWWSYVHGQMDILNGLLAGMSEAERCQLRQRVHAFAGVLTDGTRKEPHAARPRRATSR